MNNNLPADEVAIIVPTYSKMENYIPDVLRAYAKLWPSHPRIFVLTDGFYDGPNVVRGPGLSFVELLAHGISQITTNHPALKRAFILLDDLCPLWPIDTHRLIPVYNLFVTSGHGAAMFPFYDWAIDLKALRPSRAFEYSGREPQKLFHFPDGYKWRNSLAPGLWRLDYLKTVCIAAQEAGVGDPWRFEEINVSGWDHVVAGYHWPTVRHGFYVRGQINPLVFIDPKVQRTGIFRSLMRDQYRTRSYSIAMLRHYAAKVRRRAAGILHAN